MRLLFVGESWLGSCARSLKEALTRQPGVHLDEVNEDLFFPKHQAKWLRSIDRLLRGAYKRELERQVLDRVSAFGPDFVITYKGFPLDARVLARLRGMGACLINIYPDYSPHAYGEQHRKAVGQYDLVISTKPFHPAIWRETYGYSNPCVFIPQGYDAALHLVAAPQEAPRFDVTLVATWRPEYGELMKQLGELLEEKVTVGIGGAGWSAHRADYPAHWEFPGALQGRSYVNWLRQARICIAPLTRDVLINGTPQPGDEDTTRTYELAAAHCFFIHRRTRYVQTLYDEAGEVPMYDTPDELCTKIERYRDDVRERDRMATNAHRRAVPAYSLDGRAARIVETLREFRRANANRQ